MICVNIFVLFLFRTCEKHTEHMDQLDSEMEQHMQRMETRIRQEVCFTAHLDLPVHCIHKYLSSSIMSDNFSGLGPGCKESQFHSLPFGQAVANMY